VEKTPKQIPFSEKVHEILQNRDLKLSDEVSGQLLTLIESAIPDKEQREAFKSMARQTVLQTLNKRLDYRRELISSLVYNFMHRKDPKEISQSLPYWHLAKADGSQPAETTAIEFGDCSES
jgi:uncharacterized membrane protein YheB (UPF0754 family)